MVKNHCFQFPVVSCQFPVPSFQFSVLSLSDSTRHRETPFKILKNGNIDVF